MVKMIIFDPAMCCSTGLCGPVIDLELLRISTIINNLEKNGVKVERYNLNSNPQVFVDNIVINAENSLKAAISTVYEPESCSSIFLITISGSFPL